MQHQQGISSSMHHLSQPAAPVAEENQLQQKPLPMNSNMAKQESRHSVANLVNPLQTAVEPIKNPEPVLLDERALLACLVRAVPVEANSKISIKSTVRISPTPQVLLEYDLLDACICCGRVDCAILNVCIVHFGHRYIWIVTRLHSSRMLRMTVQVE